jgi:hypothetical protein
MSSRQSAAALKDWLLGTQAARPAKLVPSSETDWRLRAELRRRIPLDVDSVVTLTFASWNQIAGWLGRLAALRTLRDAA